MGAEQFTHSATGRDAQEAFTAAQGEARYDHGHAGYTGTIAEKDEFVIIEVPDNPTPDWEAADTYANQLLTEDDPRVDSKWGPAGAIQVHDSERKPTTTWLFFGWASS